MSSTNYDTAKIKLERARQGQSIVQLAEEANLSPKTVIRIEHNKVIPRPQTVGKIAAALGKDIEEFIILETD
jgi:transcriptional regulator with XRE-family HTH domain